MLISHSHRFIFFHIAKTGGISMREALLPYTTLPDKFRVQRPPMERNGKPNPLYEMWEASLLHAPARDAQKYLPAEVFDGYYKFVFVRNPWALQVSMYHFVLKEPDHLYYATVKNMASFEEYVEWVAVTAKPYPKGAPKFQADMVTDARGQIIVDEIGRFETLSHDFNRISDQLGLAITLPHRNQSSHKDYRDYYNARTRSIIADAFARDIELFGYRYE